MYTLLWGWSFSQAVTTVAFPGCKIRPWLCIVSVNVVESPPPPPLLSVFFSHQEFSMCCLSCTSAYTIFSQIYPIPQLDTLRHQHICRIAGNFPQCLAIRVVASCDWKLFHLYAACSLFKGSVEWSRHERHFCSLLPYFLLSWLQIFQLFLSFWTSSFDPVLFKKFLQEKEKYPKNHQKPLSS